MVNSPPNCRVPILTVEMPSREEPTEDICHTAREVHTLLFRTLKPSLGTAGSQTVPLVKHIRWILSDLPGPGMVDDEYNLLAEILEHLNMSTLECFLIYGTDDAWSDLPPVFTSTFLGTLQRLQMASPPISTKLRSLELSFIRDLPLAILPLLGTVTEKLCFWDTIFSQQDGVDSAPGALTSPTANVKLSYAEGAPTFLRNPEISEFFTGNLEFLALSWGEPDTDLILGACEKAPCFKWREMFPYHIVDFLAKIPSRLPKHRFVAIETACDLQHFPSPGKLDKIGVGARLAVIDDILSSHALLRARPLLVFYSNELWSR
ncbi:hypothetical protein DFH09DRAFT_1101532 [Mycena vulgaris]|nr:hypothetical protein DFH09DRAFT_1101532 [Mycena vulgaris]